MPKKYWTIENIKNEYMGYFFSPDTMRFFNSRVLSDLYEGPGGIYFVTSERGPINAGRFFTVRQYNPETKSIKTAGEFNKLTRYMAIKTAKELAK